MSNIRPGSTNYFHLGGKIDPISEIVNAGILTTGKVFWVKDVSDEDYNEFKDRVGKEFLFTDIQSALDKCTADQNDYVMVCPKADGSAWTLTTGLTMSKDKVHLVGVGSGPRDTDYGVLVEGFGTTTAATISHYGMLHVSGDGVEVAGMRFNCTAGTGAGGTIGGLGSINSDSGGVISVYGQNPYFHDCVFERAGIAWDLGTPSGLILAGSASHGGLIDNCTIQYGTETADGTCYGVDLRMNNSNWAIKNTHFQKHAVQNDEYAVKLSPGTSAGDLAILMENCTFINTNSGTAVDQFVGGTVMSGAIGLMKDCASVFVTAFHNADALVYSSPTFAGGTINNLLQNPGIGHPGTALVVTKT